MRPLVVVLAAAIASTACNQPPVKEIAAAEAALAKARDAGADRFVAERYREAEGALQEARRKVGERDYRGALSSATDAAEKARAATQAAAAARTLARSAAETALAEAAASLDEVARLREEAAAAKLPEEAFAEVAAREEQARAGLRDVQALVHADDVLGALKAAGELKAQAAELPALTAEARATWEREHPKPRRRARRR